MYQRWLSNFTGFDACFSSSILLFHHFLHVSTINVCRCYAPININLEGCEGWGGGGQTKAGDLTKEDHPLWGLVIILSPSPGGEDFWSSSDYGWHLGLEAVKDLVTSRLSVALEGVLVTEDESHCKHKDLRVFFIHTCKMLTEREHDMASVFILSILI